jgi:transketolase
VATKEKLGWPLTPTFLVPPEARDHLGQARERGAAWRRAWEDRLAVYRVAHPADAVTWDDQMAGRLPAGWDRSAPAYAGGSPPVATRDASQKFLETVGPSVLSLLGGAADLSPSTRTVLPDSPAFEPGQAIGRNFHFGVREHAMVATLNGLALHGGLIPYGGTFLTFSDYARGAIRLAALQRTHVIFVFTHDSIGMGEDGPTHQPVEHLVSLRAIPHLRVVRPADANEAVAAWKLALVREGPSALVFTRQKIPVLDPTKHPISEGVPRGGYVLAEAVGGAPRAIVIATGSEVSVALDAQQQLAAAGVPVRVVSLPCWEVFDEQPASYRASVLPPDVPKVSIEAGVTLGWSRYVGDRGRSIGVDRFGASAPGPVVLRELGVTADHVVTEVQQLLSSGGAGGDR